MALAYFANKDFADCIFVLVAIPYWRYSICEQYFHAQQQIWKFMKMFSREINPLSH